MDEKQFQKLLEQVGDLDPEQFKKLTQTYARNSGQSVKRVWDSAVYATSEERLAMLGINEDCPYCGAAMPYHYGTSGAGVQKFKCRECGKTFTRFTGTMLEKSRFPWSVWVKTLEMVLGDRSLEDMVTVLEREQSCEGINLKTVLNMRLKLIYAMAAVPPPTLAGVIQMDESFVRESQKGSRELVSYVKGLERRPRYGRHPSKLGTMGAEFATILTAIDSRSLCICKVVSLGRAPTDAVIDLIEQHTVDPAYICSDANIIYEEACDLLDLPHYIRPSNYQTVLEHAGHEEIPRNLSPREHLKCRQRNRAIRESLYREGQIDYISHREDLTYSEFSRIKQAHSLSLLRVDELHKDIKLMIEKKMTNVATRHLPAYMGFFAFRHNWRAENGHTPANAKDAEAILEYLVGLKVNFTRSELEEIPLDLPKPTGRVTQLLKEKTEQARQITANKYFKFDEEDVPSFNRRAILLDAPHSHLEEIAKAHRIKGYTKMTHWGLAAAIMKLPDLDAIIMDLILKDRHYMIAEEDLKYIESLRYARNDSEGE